MICPAGTSSSLSLGGQLTIAVSKAPCPVLSSIFSYVQSAAALEGSENSLIEGILDQAVGFRPRRAMLSALHNTKNVPSLGRGRDACSHTLDNSHCILHELGV